MRNASWKWTMMSCVIAMAMATSMTMTGCAEHPNVQSNQAAGLVEPQVDTRRVAHWPDLDNGHADSLAKLSLSVPGVSHAVAVLPSPRVIVLGIRVSPKIRPDLNTMRRRIHEKVTVEAPEIEYVYITANPGEVTELNQIATGLRIGRPLSTYQEQMTELMKTMTPNGESVP